MNAKVATALGDIDEKKIPFLQYCAEQWSPNLVTTVKPNIKFRDDIGKRHLTISAVEKAPTEKARLFYNVGFYKFDGAASIDDVIQGISDSPKIIAHLSPRMEMEIYMKKNYTEQFSADDIAIVYEPTKNSFYEIVRSSTLSHSMKRGRKTDYHRLIANYCNSLEITGAKATEEPEHGVGVFSGSELESGRTGSSAARRDLASTKAKRESKPRTLSASPSSSSKVKFSEILKAVEDTFVGRMEDFEFVANRVREMMTKKVCVGEWFTKDIMESEEVRAVLNSAGIL